MSTFEFTTTENPIMVNLEQYLSYLIIERTSEFETKIIKHDPEYQKIQMELEECYHEVLKLIPKSDHNTKIIEKIQVTIGVLEVLIERLIYLQGLRDGAFIINHLG